MESAGRVHSCGDCPCPDVPGRARCAGSIDAIERKIVATRGGRISQGKKEKSKSIFGRIVKRILPVFGKACAEGVSAMDPHGLAAGITMAGAAATGMSEVLMAKYHSPTRSWEKKMSLIPVSRIGGRKAPLELEAGPEALEEAAAAADQTKKPMELEGKKEEPNEELKTPCGGASTSKGPISLENPLSDAVYSIFCPVAGRKAQDEAPQLTLASQGPKSDQTPPPSEAVYSIFSPSVARGASQEPQSNDPTTSEVSSVLFPPLADDTEAPSTPVQATKAEIEVPEAESEKPSSEAASATEETLEAAAQQLETESPPSPAVAEPMEPSEESEEEEVAVQQEIFVAGEDENEAPKEEKEEEVAEQEEAAAPAGAEEPKEDESPAEGPSSPDQIPSSPILAQRAAPSASSAEAAAPAEEEHNEQNEDEGKRSSKELGPAIMIRRKNRGTAGHVSPIKRIPFVPPPVPSEPEVVEKEAEAALPVPSEAEAVEEEAEAAPPVPSEAEAVEKEAEPETPVPSEPEPETPVPSEAEPEPPVPSEAEEVENEAEPETPVPSEPEAAQPEAKEDDSAPSKAQLVKAEVSQAVSAANTALEMLKSKVEAYKTLIATVASPALKETKEGALQAVADVKVKVESCKAEVRDAVAEAEAAVSEAKSQVEAFKAAAEAGAASMEDASAVQSDVASAVEEADRLMKEAQAQIEAFKALTEAGDGTTSPAAAEEAKVGDWFSC